MRRLKSLNQTLIVYIDAKGNTRREMTINEFCQKQKVFLIFCHSKQADKEASLTK